MFPYDFNSEKTITLNSSGINQWSSEVYEILDYGDISDVIGFEVPANGNLKIDIDYSHLINELDLGGLDNNEEFTSTLSVHAGLFQDKNGNSRIDYGEKIKYPLVLTTDFLSTSYSFYDDYVTQGDYFLTFEFKPIYKNGAISSLLTQSTCDVNISLVGDEDTGGGDQGGGNNDPITGKTIVGEITAGDSCYTCGNGTEYHYDTYSSADLMSQLGISEGENVTVQVTSADFIPVIMILDSQGSVVNSGKDSLSLVAQSGFTVSIETFDSGDTGSYNINLI